MATASLGHLTVDLVANTAGFERGMTQAERALKSATREADRQAQSLDRLIGQIDPTVAAYSRLDKMEQQLEAHRKAGRLPTEDYKQYLAQINLARDAIGKTDKVMMSNGQSAKQLAANLRGIPAQFTDIATSLAAGQNPLTVFLQQGGQLKDMFGGVGPAAKALGGYVVGLINPFTAAAAAVGVLALAYKQGSDEATAFTNALILSGNAAGTNADQLANQAESVSESVGTVGAAAAVLAQLAASGSIPAQAFDMIAIAALKMQEATGKAAEETVKDFEKIAKDPAKAVRELNATMNFLTTSTYAQIEALQRQGDVQGAVNLAEQTYAEALTSRANKIVENLGYVEGAWLTVKNAAKDAWDSILDIGREATLDEKLATLNERLQAIKDAEEANKGPFGFSTPSDDYRKEQTEKDITALLVEQEESRRRSAAASAIVAQDKKGIAAVEALNKGLEETAPKTEKLAKRFAEIDKQVAAAASRGVQYSDAQIAQLRKAAEEQYKATATPKSGPKAVREDAGQKMLDNLRQQSAALQLQSVTNEKLGTQAQALAKFQQEIADIKSKDIQTADQKSLLASEALITAQLKRNVALEQEVAARKQATEEAGKLAAFQENQASKLANAKDGLNSQLAGLGEGDKLRERLQEDLAIRKEYQTELDRLNKQFNTGEISEDLYAQETLLLEENLAARLEMQQEYYALVDEAQGSFFLGASEAWANYLTEATDVAAQTETLFGQAFDGLTDALYDFVTTGELSFRDLAASFAQTALKMLIQYAAAQAISAGLNAFSSTAAIPIVGPLAAPAAAASALAFAGGLSSQIAGMAHDGIDSVPETGTWLLQKGERVTTAQTSAKLDKTLDGMKSPSGGGGTTVNLIEDASRAGQSESRTDEKGDTMLDVFVADLLGDGKTKSAISQKFGLTSVGR